MVDLPDTALSYANHFPSGDRVGNSSTPLSVVSCVNVACTGGSIAAVMVEPRRASQNPPARPPNAAMVHAATSHLTRFGTAIDVLAGPMDSSPDSIDCLSSVRSFGMSLAV